MASTKRQINGDPAAQVRRKLKREAVRKNPDNILGLKYQSDRASKELRSRSGNPVIVRRQRAANEALPVTSADWKKSTYRYGDGDTPAFQRPGSDHSNLKSFGDRT